MEHEMQNLIKVWLLVLASLSYCYTISSTVPKGKLRLFSLLPVFSLFSAVPLLLSAVLSTTVTAFFVTWLCNFKLLLFAFDLGPLSPPKPFFTFFLLACFPVKIASNQPYLTRQTSKSPLELASKVLLSAVLVRACDYRELWHPKLVIFVYSLAVYLLIDVILWVCNAAACSALGVEVESPSDEPYLTTSLQDFWSRRWNLIASNALRHTVYKPVRAVLEGLVRPRWAQAAAVMAAFVVSGLLHEAMYYYVIRVEPTWEVTWFFVLHGVCVVVESDVKRWWLGGSGWRVHRVVSGPLTVAFVVVTAEWLFFAPILRNGVDVRILDELKGPFVREDRVYRLRSANLCTAFM